MCNQLFIGVRGLSNGVNQIPGIKGQNIGGYFQASNHRVKNVGVAGIVINRTDDGNSLFENIGGEFFAESQEGRAFGVSANAEQGTNNIGVIATARGTGPNSGGNSAIGGDFTASGASVNYGIKATATITAGNYAGFFNGNVLATGTGTFLGSDVNLKTNINGIENGLETIMQLKPVSYEFNHEVDTDLNLANGRNYGLIAQEVEAIIPELIGTFKAIPTFNDSLESAEQFAERMQQKQEFKAINFTGLIPFLIKSVQDLKQQVDGLQGQLNNCCKNTSTSTMRLGNTNSTQLDSVKLTDYQSIILNQNVPNPFADETTITYKIDQDFTTAKVLFFTSDGKILKEVTIKQKGEGQIHVFADDLSSGVYSYSLVVDNKLFDTKRMVKTNR